MGAMMTLTSDTVLISEHSAQSEKWMSEEMRFYADFSGKYVETTVTLTK